MIAIDFQQYLHASMESYWSKNIEPRLKALLFFIKTTIKARTRCRVGFKCIVGERRVTKLTHDKGLTTKRRRDNCGDVLFEEISGRPYVTGV